MLGSFLCLLLVIAVIAVAVAAGGSDDSITSATVPGATTTLPGSAAATTVAGSPATTLVGGAPATTVAGSPATTVVAGTPAPNPPRAPVALATCVTVTELSPMSGSRGEVALYQQTLKNLGFDPGDVDGSFGPNTFAAGLAELGANGTGGFGVDVFPDDQAILEPTLIRLGISCNGQAPAPPAAPAPTSPPAPVSTQTPPNILNSFVTMREFPDEDPYFFDLVAGDRVVVTLDADPSAGADPFIRLIDPSGAEIDFDDDGGGGLNSLIDTVVSQSGTFTVFYQSVGSTGPGPGQITVLIN